MSSDEEAAMMGRLVKEYVDSKKNVAALQVRLKEIGNALTKVGQTLSGGAYLSPGLDADVAALPSPANLKGVLGELKEAMQKMEGARQSLKDLGVDNIT